MSRASKKVKDSQPRRYKITLVKTVTFRLTSVTEVQINDGDISWNKTIGKSRIEAAAEQALEAERLAGIEREWSTTFVDGNHEISVDRSSIEEIEPHIEITADTEPSR